MKVDALTLLERWQQGRLDDAGVAVLRRLLDDPQSAAALAAEVRHVHALREVLQQRRAATRQPRAWWRPRALWAAAAVVAITCLGTWMWWPTSGWRLVAGEVVVGERVIAAPAALTAGVEFRTTSTSATLRAADGTAVEVAARSQVRAMRRALDVRLHVDQGQVTCAVRPQQPGAFTIVTAEAEVVVRGTRFSVTSDPGVTRVAVDEGRVSVRRQADGTELLLQAGGRTSVRVTGDLRDEAVLQPGPAWSDRRPLALLRLWTATDKIGNPRSYAFVPPGADLTTDAGRAQFATALRQAGTSIGNRLVAAGYQGVIVWDVEGQQHNDLLYVGDPRRLPDLAPEMVSAADGFFAALAATGLHTGVLLRPQRLERDATAPAGWRQRGDIDQAAELVDKARWVRERWGCSLFFINAMTTSPGPDGRHLPRGALAMLAGAIGAERGDTLIITDRPAGDEWGVAAGWMPLMGSGASPLAADLLSAHPRLLRVNYWPAAGPPPTIDGGHEILMREVDHLTP